MSRKYLNNFRDEKVNIFKKLLSEKIAFKNLIYIAFGLSIVNLIFVIALQKYLPPQVPLFYGAAEGEEQLTSSLGLLIPGCLSIILILLNSLLSLFLESSFLQKILSVVSFTVTLLSAITVTKIILLIGSF
jgi:hypothetical protein